MGQRAGSHDALTMLLLAPIIAPLVQNTKNAFDFDNALDFETVLTATAGRADEDRDRAVALIKLIYKTVEKNLPSLRVRGVLGPCLHMMTDRASGHAPNGPTTTERGVCDGKRAVTPEPAPAPLRCPSRRLLPTPTFVLFC